MDEQQQHETGQQRRDFRKQQNVRIDQRASLNDGQGDWLDVQTLYASGRYTRQHRTSQPFVRSADEGAGGEFEVVTVRHQPQWVNELIRDLSNSSPGKQIAIGGVSGLCSGYVVGRIGKAAALALGGSLIILQVAHYQGLIQINWNHVQRSVESTRQTLHHHFSYNLSTFLYNVREFSRRHIFLAGSFGTGFLLGIAI